MAHGETLFRATVTVDPQVDADRLDEEDRKNPMLANGGTRVYLLRAGDAEGAASAALDHFHDHAAIAMLEDFDIDAEAVRLSALSARSHYSQFLIKVFPFRRSNHSAIIPASSGSCSPGAIR